MQQLKGDAVAGTVTALCVATYVVTVAGWGVPLIGSSHRWAALVIVVLGAIGCAAGYPERGWREPLLGTLGMSALALSILSLATGSRTWLGLLVVAIVTLFGLATARHHPREPRGVEAHGH
jgi:hypothetical protein